MRTAAYQLLLSFDGPCHCGHDGLFSLHLYQQTPPAVLLPQHKHQLYRHTLVPRVAVNLLHRHAINLLYPRANTCCTHTQTTCSQTHLPPACHYWVTTGHRCLALRRLPADEPQVSWLLQLMELAVSARSCLRERAFAMPPVPVVKIKHTAEVQVRFYGLGFRV